MKTLETAQDIQMEILPLKGQKGLVGLTQCYMQWTHFWLVMTLSEFTGGGDEPRSWLMLLNVSEQN